MSAPQPSSLGPASQTGNVNDKDKKKKKTKRKK